MNEPTAAAVAFGLERKFNGAESNVLVFDLGGGTFDVSVLTQEEGIYEVKSTSGDTHLGGRDFDVRGAEHLKKEIKREHQKEISTKEPAYHRLSIAFEQAKRILSSNRQSDVSAKALLQSFDLETSITRARFVYLFVFLLVATLNIYFYFFLSSRAGGILATNPAI